MQAVRAFLVAVGAGVAVAVSASATGADPARDSVAIAKAKPKATPTVSAKLRRRISSAVTRSGEADEQSRSAAALATEPRTAGEPGPNGSPGVGGPPGPPGPSGSAGAQGPSLFSGAPSAGTTVTGVWGGRFAQTRSSGAQRHVVTLPVPATAPLADQDVGFGASPHVSDVLSNQCRGTVAEPTAKPGTVCLYLDDDYGIFDIGNLRGVALTPDVTSPVNATGFVVELNPSLIVNAPETIIQAGGTWAYTYGGVTP